MTNKIFKRSAAFMAIIIAIISCFAALSVLVGCGEKEEEKVALTITKIDKTTNTINVGEEFTLKVTTSRALEEGEAISWKSDKDSVATVDANGKVKGVASGEATVTASVNDSSLTCKVTVNDKKEFTLNTNGATIDLDNEDKTVTLEATCVVNGAADTSATVTWTSSKPEVATVENGVVTGLTAGSTTITATCNGLTATCEVKVVRYIAVGSQNDITDASKWYNFGAGVTTPVAGIAQEGGVAISSTPARFDLFRVYKDPADEASGWVSVVDQVNNCGEKIFGYEYLFNVNLTATGNFNLILGATDGLPAAFNGTTHRGIYLFFTDGKIELKQSGVGGDTVQATATYEGKIADIKSVTFSITRLSKTELLFGLYVNGTQLGLTGSPANGAIRGGSYLDNYSVNQSNGYGPRFGVVPSENTTVTISGSSVKRSETK